ncbi:hypothetical protein ACIBKX_16745 [Streptomyces sp. NPDC050658]|uniref:hypothetical protein n=1 Tax=unclassified Streptomyces TaxID=2593676 RepID=UPI003426A970
MTQTPPPPSGPGQDRVARWLPPALRDAADADGPRLLDALLAAVDRQRLLLSDDIQRAYDDLFVDSCADWAVPYIGALLGLGPDAERLEVAHAVALRRRKGTPAALEDFAFAVTGLIARVGEGWQTTLWAQRLGHPPPPRTAALDLRDRASLSRIGTPFERSRRSVRPAGPWTPRSVTAVVWPWTVRQLVDMEAAPLDPSTPKGGRLALHPLGIAAPLYLRPREARVASEGADPVTRTGDEADAPTRATYRVLEALAGPGDITYGGSLTLAARHPVATPPGVEPQLIALSTGAGPVSWEQLRFGGVPPGGAPPAPPPGTQVLVDAQRGFVQLGADLAGPVRATWYRAVPGRVGALASLADTDPAARVVVEVSARPGVPGAVTTLAAAFALAEQRSAALAPEESVAGVPDVEIRLLSSDRLAAPASLEFTPRLPRWRIVAPPLATPAVIGDLELRLVGARVSLEGFFLKGSLIAGPGLAALHAEGLTMDPGAGELRTDPAAWELSLSATRCVLGPIRAELSALPVTLTECVVDGRRRRFHACGPASEGGPMDAVAPVDRFGPVLHADSVTFAGPVRADAVDARDCVFADGLDVVQQQEGCVRTSHLGPGLSDPPRHPATYRCRTAPAPAFVSDAFESSGYYCLDLEPGQPLLSAAGDGGEAGAYHATRRASRIRRLRRRIGEFTPLGLTAEVSVAPWEE